MPKTSSALSTLIEAKVKSIGQLLAKAQAIRARYEQIWRGATPNITGPFDDALADIVRASNTIAPAAGPTMAMGAAIGQCDVSFAAIARLFRGFVPKEIVSDVSPTFLMTTAQEIASFAEYWAMAEADGVGQQIYDGIVAELVRRPQADVEAEYRSAGDSAIALYARYLTAALGTSKLATDAAAALERAKTAVLLPPGYTQPPSCWPMQRMGLIPGPTRKTPSELMTIYFGGRGSGVSGGGSGSGSGASFADFIAAARAKKMNVIAIVYTTPSVIEYDISKLVEGPATEPTAGVNAKILDRFAIVRVREPESAVMTTRPTFELKRYDHCPTCKWAVVRSLDGGTTWDVMTGGGSGGGSTELHIDDAIVTAMSRGPSPRVDAYNEMKNGRFAAAFRRAPDVVDEIKADNKPLVNSLVARITGRIVQYVDKKLVPLPTRQADLEAAIEDPMFVDIMSEELLGSYAESGVSANAPADEYLGSFIADAERDIIVQFSRNLRLGMLELGPGPNVFRDYSGETLKTRLYNIFVDVIKKSVVTSLQTKENVYDKILIKDALVSAIAATDALPGDKS